MKILKKVILTAVICATVFSVISSWIFFGDWPFLPFLLLAGFFIILAQAETKSYKFLGKLAIGSAIFGFLIMFLVSMRMYIMSHFVYNSNFPFLFWLKQESLMMMLVFIVACFLGGLLGIVLKGFYTLYKNKLDKIIIFAGPLLAILSSLSIIKIKVGGTIKSALHGWPYPFLTHQIKDIVGDFQIDKWIFSPGSLYHYIVFNYLLYLIIFFLAYCLIKLINKKLKIKKINTATFLFGLLILMIIAFTSFLPVKKLYISHQIARAGYCETDSDCASPGTSCPFNCAIAVNRNESDRITKLIYSFPSTCDNKNLCNYMMKVFCLENKCQVSIGKELIESNVTAGGIKRNINHAPYYSHYNKYYNEKYDLSFEYPSNLDITKDEAGSKEDYWITTMQTSDYNTEQMGEARVDKINVGMAISVSIKPNQVGMSGNNELIKDFEELKELKRLGFGGPTIVKEEEIERKRNGRKYFIQTFGKEYENNIRLAVSTICKPGFVVEFRVSGIDLYSEEIKWSIYKFMDVLKCN